MIKVVVKSNLQRPKKEVRLKVIAALRASGKAYRDEAKRLVPVDTGHLESTIDFAMEGRGMAVRYMVGADYAIYVEYGTVNMAAQPFFRPGVEKGRQVFTSVMNSFGVVG